MKKFAPVFAALLICASFSLSSCARSCGGSWYNNRNVQVTPQLDVEEMTANVVEYSSYCREN